MKCSFLPCSRLYAVTFRPLLSRTTAKRSRAGSLSFVASIRGVLRSSV